MDWFWIYPNVSLNEQFSLIKDRTESFDDDYFPCTKVNANCNILEIGLTYLLAVIIEEAILKLTEPLFYHAFYPSYIFSCFVISQLYIWI